MADSKKSDSIPYELEHSSIDSSNCQRLQEVLFTEAPVMMLRFDKDCRVLAVNKQTVSSVGHTKSDLLGQLCGDAINCVNACLEKECGQEELCALCNLRKCIERTFSKGSGIVREQCAVTVTNGATPKELQYLVTTSLIESHGGQEVLARLDDITELKNTKSQLSERKRLNEVLESRRRLFSFATNHNLDELLEESLNFIEKITASKIGFYHFVEPCQSKLSLQNWSTKTKDKFCQAEGKGSHYDIAAAGVWVEAFHERKAVIHNDYQRMSEKKGMPAGHAIVTRELVVPVIRGDKVVALLGVGNKEDDYTDEDALIVSRFADLVWDIADRKLFDDRVEHLNRMLRAIRNINQLIVRERHKKRLIQQACSEMVDCGSALSAWIATCDSDGKPHLWAEAGCKGAFKELTALLAGGSWPCCYEKLMKCDEGILSISQDEICYECPVHEQCKDDVVAIVKMEHDGRDYGVFTLNMSSHISVDEEEKSLLLEVAGDVAFALRTIAGETERKQLEEQLLQAQKMEAIGRLAGGIAHDFNNLLTIINSNADLALSDLDDKKELKNELEEIQEAGERAALLTKQLLAFSRQQLVDKKAIDLNIIIRNLEKMLVRVIGADVELTTELHDDVSPIFADAGQIEQILMNLVVNSRDAMPTGGKLKICTHVEKLAELDYVFLSVTDTGVGMDEKIKSHIFEPFFTTKGQGKGTGLGLSTVFGIVRQSDGEIKVVSTVGFGTTFELRFPTVNALPENIKPKKTSDFELGSETILLVEDEKVLQNLCKRMLSSAGYNVIVASDGEEALKKYKKHKSRIQFVLTDVIMPKVGGIELVKKLDELKAELRVLYMSGFVGNRDIPQAKTNLITDFIAKPFNRQQILRKVREVLDK